VSFQYVHPRDEMLAFLPATARTLLDIGCGQGAFGAALQREAPELETWAVEPDPLAAEAARGKYTRVLDGFFPQDVQVPAGYFDVAFCNDVLEHMVEPQEALRALAPVLRPGGVVIASIPNVRHVTATYPLLVKGRWTYRDSGILDRTHVRFFTRSSIRRLFEDEGWTVQCLTGINRRVRLEGVDTPALRLLDRLTAGRASDFFFLQYAVVAQPPVSAAAG
jgi:2-polyprenyl-3-methyl-5-hydroxy-6-metoxy-1,4-benzoquinol methylase